SVNSVLTSWWRDTGIDKSAVGDMLGTVLMLLTCASVMAPSERNTDPSNHGVVQGVRSERTRGSVSNNCPTQCRDRGGVVMECHQAHLLDMLQLSSCLSRSSNLLVLDLSSWHHTCNCSLLGLALGMSDTNIVIFVPLSCGMSFMEHCGSEIQQRTFTLHHRGLVAGLVMEQNGRDYRKATRRHMTRLWTTVNSLPPGHLQDSYRNLTIQAAKVIRRTKRSFGDSVLRLLPLLRDDDKWKRRHGYGKGDKPVKNCSSVRVRVRIKQETENFA
ncbi:hypothetical protein BaRGS_00027512, partial [Batillaria attramentaria]